MNICTIIAKNYVAHARTLAESFVEHHPDGTCFTLIIDGFNDDQIDPANEPFTIVRPSDLDLAPADFDDMRARYSVLEFSTAVKPWLLRHMLDEHDDGSGIAYFDPDIRVYSRMEELEQALRDTSIVLTPHLTKPMPRDGMKPSETDIMIAGIYNLGFIGLSAGADADALIQFWEERLRTDCWVAPEQGLFVDQKWIDWIPGLFTDLTILRVPSYNVAYWNVPTRDVTRQGSEYTVDGWPLRFFHFSGYSPDHPTFFSKHQNRVQLVPHSPLGELCRGYGERLLANDFQRVRSFQYDHDVLPSGERLDSFSRALYRRGMDDGVIQGSIFTPAGELDLVAWMSQAEPGSPGVSRYLHELWTQRVDLQRAYPDLAGADLEGFLGWCRVYGPEQVPMARRMLGADAPAASPAPAVAPTPAAPAASSRPVAGDLTRPFGVNVAGYLRSELGIGEVARQMNRALDAAAIPSLPRVLDAPGSRQGHAFTSGSTHEAPYPVNLIFVNADGLPGFVEEVSTDGFLEGRRSIGYWWWELQEFPERYHGAFDLVDEVWVGSSFVADAIRAHATVPVVKIPVPMDVAVPPPLEPGRFGWPEDAFTFFFSWDYNSVFRRKNPLGVVEAYTSAFSPEDGAALVLKCINAKGDSGNHHELLRAIAGRDDIVLIDDYVPQRDKDRLMATCDCYVSLHRSEGLGLTMAEAMLFGKPVIATNYSGNTDFMTAENSYLVDYELALVGEGAAPYDSTAHWAEPDLAHAARLMRNVFEQPEEARARAERGRQKIATEYSAAAVGKTVAQRLERFREAPTALPIPSGAPAIADSLPELISRGALPRAPSRFGKPGAAARKALLRILRPYSAYQNDVNHGVLQRIERVTDDLATQAALDLARVELTHAQDLSAILADLRRQRHGIETLVEVVTNETLTRAAESSKLVPFVRETERLVAETRALPYMASEALTTFETPGVGRVFGYTDAPDGTPGGDEYRAFEELFRGSEAFITGRQRRYLPLIDPAGPVVDLGCGRGEFLDLMAEAGIETIGVDSDAGMVHRCKEKGHGATVETDVIAYLESCDDGSLGTIFSAQVVEHLPPAVLRQLFALAERKLRPGGRFIAETVNPHSVSALKTFWVDVTHHHPLFPEVMVAFSRIAGFQSAYVFHPNGEGDVDRDRITTGEYALVATR